MKTCFKCKAEKPLTEYYRHDAMNDGHLGKCKECTKSDAMAYRVKNLARVKEYDRNRPNHAERIANNKAQYQKDMADEQKRARRWANAAMWRMANPLKRKAHIVTSNAIRGGKLEKKPCEHCGAAEKVHAHHEDYNKPLDVNWLCVDCHGARHREINAERRAG
jgi:hypothetical protein